MELVPDHYGGNTVLISMVSNHQADLSGPLTGIERVKQNARRLNPANFCFTSGVGALDKQRAKESEPGEVFRGE
ncbi:hypothetical protein HHI_06389 [Hyphomonas hirschiana VP5]|uniref:Uncharacterized protein n=1 Tax=Hyphomonas hirschiana VP5 TaxID=1280951 RepID=A0A059FXE3_9PROT|nr:hypothetical protein HHI_06389 [Hyphomonas hirschiana VP5]